MESKKDYEKSVFALCVEAIYTMVNVFDLTSCEENAF